MGLLPPGVAGTNQPQRTRCQLRQLRSQAPRHSANMTAPTETGSLPSPTGIFASALSHQFFKEVIIFRLGSRDLSRLDTTSHSEDGSRTGSETYIMRRPVVAFIMRHTRRRLYGANGDTLCRAEKRANMRLLSHVPLVPAIAHRLRSCGERSRFTEASRLRRCLSPHVASLVRLGGKE